MTKNVLFVQLQMRPQTDWVYGGIYLQVNRLRDRLNNTVVLLESGNVGRKKNSLNHKSI